MTGMQIDYGALRRSADRFDEAGDRVDAAGTKHFCGGDYGAAGVAVVSALALATEAVSYLVGECRVMEIAIDIAASEAKTTDTAVATAAEALQVLELRDQ